MIHSQMRKWLSLTVPMHNFSSIWPGNLEKTNLKDLREDSYDDSLIPNCPILKINFVIGLSTLSVLLLTPRGWETEDLCPHYCICLDFLRDWFFFLPFFRSVCLSVWLSSFLLFFLSSLLSFYLCFFRSIFPFILWIYLLLSSSACLSIIFS